jgi:hypothetical protein
MRAGISLLVGNARHFSEVATRRRNIRSLSRLPRFPSRGEAGQHLFVSLHDHTRPVRPEYRSMLRFFRGLFRGPIRGRGDLT